ncbi:MAG: DUF1992 domain-containing protein [Verrucomicrobiae bacterium]|nr:DUF1992 domain-containing protein [Verrucomicrobiae bacterium]
MSWNPPIEDAISEWVRGESVKGEAIEGTGLPIDLADYYATPAELRVGYAMLKSNGFCPAEVGLLRQIRELESRLETAKCDGSALRDDDVTRWRRELTDALTRLGLSQR